MKVIIFCAILGLTLAGGFLPFSEFEEVRNEFWDVDIGNLISDGADAVSDIESGNGGKLFRAGADIAGDLIGNHQLGVDGGQTIADIASGNASPSQLLVDGAKDLGDVTNYKDLVSDGIKTYNDVTSGNASPTQLLEDGATLAGDAIGQHDTVADGIKTINDIASGKATPEELAKDGISLAGDLTGNQKLASDINAGISVASKLLVGHNSEELFDLSNLVVDGEEAAPAKKELVDIPVAFLNEMF